MRFLPMCTWTRCRKCPWEVSKKRTRKQKKQAIIMYVYEQGIMEWLNNELNPWRNFEAGAEPDQTEHPSTVWIGEERRTRSLTRRSSFIWGTVLSEPWMNDVPVRSVRFGGSVWLVSKGLRALSVCSMRYGTVTNWQDDISLALGRTSFILLGGMGHCFYRRFVVGSMFEGSFNFFYCLLVSMQFLSYSYFGYFLFKKVYLNMFKNKERMVSLIYF